MKRRRFIETTLDEGQRGRLWAYGYADLARLMDVHEGTLRNWVCAKKFDPGNLLAVAREIVKAKGMTDPPEPEESKEAA